jgi:hypothetical protein
MPFSARQQAHALRRGFGQGGEAVRVQDHGRRGDLVGGDGAALAVIFGQDLAAVMRLHALPERVRDEGGQASTAQDLLDICQEVWGCPLNQDTDLVGSWEDPAGEDVFCGFVEAEGLHP